MREFKECYKVIEVMVVIMVMRVIKVMRVMVVMNFSFLIVLFRIINCLVVLNFVFCDFIGESAYIEQLETVVNHNRQ